MPKDSEDSFRFQLSGRLAAVLGVVIAVAASGGTYVFTYASQNTRQDERITSIQDRLTKIETRLDSELIGQKRFDDFKQANDQAHTALENRMDKGFAQIRDDLAEHTRQTRSLMKRERLNQMTYPPKEYPVITDLR